jgi:integrase
MEDWLANLEREGRVAPSTLTLYRSHVTHHILPAMGERDVGDVDARSLDAFYGTLAETLAPSTIRVIHWIVMAALRQAHDWDLLATLPRPRPPRVPHAEREPLTPEQVQALMDAATERNEDAVALLIRLGAVTGARRGELCGLQVSDYDRDARSLAIRRQITGERTITAPKGGKQRTVAIGARTAQAIDDYLAVQRERFRYEHGPWLLSEDGGVTALMPNRVSEAIMRLGRKLKITVTTHALRHYHDSLGVASGVDVVTMAARAGHTPDVAARVYMHRVSSADQRAADVMEGLLVP